MTSSERFHVLACPATRRAIRQKNERVNWCLDYVAKILDGKVTYSDVRKKGLLSPGVIFHCEHTCDLFLPSFTLTTRRSKLYRNEVVLLISQNHSYKGAEFELLVKRSQPVAIV
jgi:hypothetical protein